MKELAIIPLVIAILVTGFITGILTGASIKAGQDIDPNSIAVNILGIFCKSIAELNNPTATNTCFSTYIMMTLGLIVIGVVEVVATAALMENFWVGLILYGVGWFFGLIIILVG
jgi:hypothetical protein